MKLLINDPSGAEHNVQDVLLEFAQMHAQAQAILGAIDQRLATIEAQLGIEYNLTTEETDNG